MSSRRASEKCAVSGCSRNRDVSQRRRHCHSHAKKVTIDRFLGQAYTRMFRRVTKGACTKRPDLYLGKPILPREAFLNWSKNHPDFLKLYKQWVMGNYDRKLTPTVNRVRSNRGYTLDNMEWLTNSQNCGLSAFVTKMRQRKAIYQLVGVKIDEK
jgi:hypothetical protein